MNSLKNILNGIKYALDKKADKKIVDDKFDEIDNLINQNSLTGEDALDMLFSSELITPAVVGANIMTNDDGDILIL